MKIKTLVTLSLTTLLTACGGGSGGDTSEPSVAPTTSYVTTTLDSPVKNLLALKSTPDNQNPDIIESFARAATVVIEEVSYGMFDEDFLTYGGEKSYTKVDSITLEYLVDYWKGDSLVSISSQVVVSEGVLVTISYDPNYLETMISISQQGMDKLYVKQGVDTLYIYTPEESLFYTPSTGHVSYSSGETEIELNI